MTLSTRNVGTIQNGLRRYGQAAIVRARKVVKDSLDRQYNESLSECPIDNSDAGAPDEFHMIDRLHAKLTNDGLGSEIGFDSSDFTSAGQEFYPVYVIFGTRFVPARDFLFGPAQAERPVRRRALIEALSPSRGAQPPGRQ